MLQKAYAEGLRALASTPRRSRTRSPLAAGAGRRSSRETVNDLLLPLVKGFGSERAYELLAQSLQTFGGSGYLQDYPIEQYIRDAKIDSLYEGTTAIQALDLFFRKIVRDKGQALGIARRRDPGVRRQRGRQRPAEGGARAARARRSTTSRAWSAPWSAA